MARKKRMYLPGMTYHIVQRGNNDGQCFYEEDCYRFYLNCLKDALRIYRGNLHAYVLMHNLVNLLLTPDSAESVPLIMKVVGSRYTLYVNGNFQRTGTLWDGRYKASIVCADTHLLLCHRYIESLPVKRGLVNHPGEYLWSSYSRNAFADGKVIVTPHTIYRNLGSNIGARCAAYRELFFKLPDEELDEFQKSLYRGHLLGSNDFRHEVEKKLGCSLGYTKCGRPRKTSNNNRLSSI